MSQTGVVTDVMSLPTTGGGLEAEAQELDEQPLPLFLRSSIFPLLAIIIAAVVWAAMAQVDRIVVAHGRLITTQPTLVVQPFETGVIRSIDVAIGRKVKQGQVLVTLDPTLVRTSENELRYRQVSLAAEVARLAAELDEKGFVPERGEAGRLQAALALQRRSEFEARIAGFQASAKRLEEKRSAAELVQQSLQQRLELAKDVEGMRQQLLAREIGSRLALLQTKQERLTVEEQLTANRAELADLGRQIESVRADRDSFVQNWRRDVTQRLVDAQRDRETVEQQLSAITRRGELMVLRAPADGTVLELGKRSIGSVVSATETLVTLVPTDAATEAEVEIGPQDIGHVRIGDSARVKFESLPFQRHGSAVGTVRVIGDDVLPSDQGPGKARSFVYRTRLTVDGSTLRNVPARFRALPGMELTADVKVGTRSILSYFLEPILRVFDESLREP
jgi:HlyD family secretion protein